MADHFPGKGPTRLVRMSVPYPTLEYSTSSSPRPDRNAFLASGEVQTDQHSCLLTQDVVANQLADNPDLLPDPSSTESHLVGGHHLLLDMGKKRPKLGQHTMLIPF
jgi:hypothetical protein